ncbi:hypothetical protein FQR65_LT02691 [Abscondita terminalis]|nr:hypothetical protein FQR65_LT02691 [Abscondita terminalis]
MFLTTRHYYVFFIYVLIHFNLSSTYKTMNLDDSKLCSVVTNRKIKLESDSSSALIVSLGRLKDHFWSWEKNFVCTFKVHSQHASQGLYIVIQNLSFRRNISDDCIDYVRFMRGDGTLSKKYCGYLNATLGMHPIYAPENYAADLAPTVNSFIDPRGMVEVVLHINREALKAYEESELKIVFTTFWYCLSAPKDKSHSCSTEHKEHCIYKGFFNDSHVNCPYPGCVDENGCSNEVQELHSTVGNKVVIGSVTTLFIMFVLFICCIWFCRKYKRLCWSDNFSGPSEPNQNMENRETNESNMHNISMSSSARVVSSSARANVNSDEDKDLPPSYDSLFPNR